MFLWVLSSVSWGYLLCDKKRESTVRNNNAGISCMIPSLQVSYMNFCAFYSSLCIFWPNFAVWNFSFVKTHIPVSTPNTADFSFLNIALKISTLRCVRYVVNMTELKEWLTLRVIISIKDWQRRDNGILAMPKLITRPRWREVLSVTYEVWLTAYMEEAQLSLLL